MSLAVLALEPDPRKVNAIKEVMSSIRDARLSVVRSKEQLLDALRDSVPDVVLLPALLPFADEAKLIDALRSTSESRHLEVVVTPYEIAQDTGEGDIATGWRRLLNRTSAPAKAFGCSVGAFGERVRWALHCVRLARLEQAQQFEWFGRTAFDAPENRRAHRRFAPTELPWLQIARLRGGAKLRLLDLSAGGALVQSDTRLTRDVEGLLEIVAGKEPSLVPFRVTRWHPSSRDRDFPYLGAFEFTQPFEFDNVGGPLATIGPATVEDTALAPFLRTAAEHHERDPRWTRDQVPWLSSINLPWDSEVSLLNISKSGMLIETTSKLAPGSNTEFRLCGPETDQRVSTMVVRSEIGSVNPHGVTYQAAVTFSGELMLPQELDGTPAPKKLARLLNDVLKDAGRGSKGSRELKEIFTDGVRKLVRARQVAISGAPMPSDADGESIYFTVPGTSGSPAVLQATFERDHVPTEAEFLCLRSAASLTAAVLELERL